MLGLWLLVAPILPEHDAECMPPEENGENKVFPSALYTAIYKEQGLLPPAPDWEEHRPKVRTAMRIQALGANRHSHATPGE